jgi:hypothetical protein
MAALACDRIRATMKHSIPTQGRLLTPKELQHELRTSHTTLSLLLREGMPHVVISRGEHRARRRFVLEDVLRWLADRDGKAKLRPKGVH